MAAQNVVRMTPGPTIHAVAHIQDIALTFITTAIKKIILEITNLEGFCKYGDNWKRMVEIDLRAYIGLIILAGVYKVPPKVRIPVVSVMQSGMAIFHATIFHATEC